MDQKTSIERIQPEFQYIEDLITYRLNRYYYTEADNTKPDFPDLNYWQLPLANFIQKNKLSEDEAVLLLLGLAPHIKPDLYDKVIERKIGNSGDFPGIGGVRGKNCRFFLPTGETALFLLTDDNVDRRLQVQQFFGAEHLFWEKKILWLEDMQNGEPSMHGRLIMSPDYIDLLTYGIHKSPQFSISFPAKKIAPSKDPDAPGFDQLVIPNELHDQIDELKSWLKYNDRLMDTYGMRKKLKQGYRTLFYGPPGTGKTFTAQILGNELKKEVFKIDLSMIVSKYIGETEKNLELLFARAEDKGWILFFDEADALFGKRTGVRDAHDKYANQEVSYLLQRIEDYNGLIILATNMKNNIDDSFIRRFNSMLKFPFPESAQRAQIWRKAFPPDAIFVTKQTVNTEDGNTKGIREELIYVDIPDLVKKYEMSGGSIINVVHYAAIKAVERMELEPEIWKRIKTQKQITGKVNETTDRTIIAEKSQLVFFLSDVQDGVKREMTKEGKPFTI
ncbi:MAG: ATP-binding protein [Saprospiraceae bacterium]|uniref:ATP-binding protein n=1 Tax=Candidatus Opimibacter skivensis TaxID=2982028 RepID=A0A9D7SVP2_9BACT|nr:ATP-binding protein [Candidatus Opimibacter skivensis]